MSSPQLPAKAAGSSKPRPQSIKGQRVGGRQKGTPNKVTATFRETVQRLLDDNAGNVSLWLAEIADGTPDRKVGKVTIPGRPRNPDGALLRLAQLAEFAAPKLNRSEVVGEGGGPLTVVIKKEA
jgi:hypothetical protein